jgi:hypothetical protein
MSGGPGGIAVRPCLRTAVCLACAAALLAPQATRADVPAWLPRYDVDMRVDVDGHEVLVHQRVRWTNNHQVATRKLVFNAHAHYSIPDKEIGFLAKMLEILRMAPKDCLDFGGPPLTVRTVGLAPVGPNVAVPAVQFGFAKDNDTALEVELPFPINPGESVALDLEYTLRLPQKQGRWGQWKGVTFLAQWLPVLAYYDDTGWQPAPFIPWHQPFFNEAGEYHVRATLPAGQKVAASAAVAEARDLGNGWQQIDFAPACLRDFAFFASAEFKEFTAPAGDTTVRVVALPGHEWYAQEMLKIACEALPLYCQWFGPYPYPQFTVVESYFGWNGNECGGLVMIDERIFAMPHMARNFVDSLLTHEICHQWWYNLVGTNGYAETWMDEGLATHFSHKVMDLKYGKNNQLVTWPKGLGWLPNIHRDDYRHYGMMGTMGRDEMGPVVQPMPGFGHLVNLMSMAYDRGGRVVGIIEDRLGPTAFLDFMRQVRGKYEYRILRVADFQRELEAYDKRSWDEFFQNWLFKTGMVDWAIEKVDLEPVPGSGAWWKPNRRGPDPHHATIVLRQKGENSEPTVLGFRFRGDDEGFQLRIPIDPGRPVLELEDEDAQVHAFDDGVVVVDVMLPERPTQIMVDPDKVLLDRDPLNNTWKPEVKFRITPIYTTFEETDITNAYDRWNVVVGPWIYGSSYNDPWYTKSAMFGVRAAAYRTQEFMAAGYLAYRTEDRNVVAGVDAFWDHVPVPHMQFGFNAERSLAQLGNGDPACSRAAVFGRYVLTYGDSLYLPPFHYVEAFASVQNHNLPDPAQTFPGEDMFDDQTVAGLHYHINYLTPYWDPEGGFALDLTGQQGFPIFGEHQWSEQVFGQLSFVKEMPEWLGWLRKVPGGDWLMDTRWAFRIHGAAGWPENARLFALGGGDLFRGYDQRQRQNNMNWVGSIEWRVPLWQDLDYPVCDHVATFKSLYATIFWDCGDAYFDGHSMGPVAHCFGAGLRLDVSWFGLIERTMLGIDFAKTINDSTPLEVWLRIQHAF